MFDPMGQYIQDEDCSPLLPVTRRIEEFLSELYDSGSQEALLVADFLQDNGADPDLEARHTDLEQWVRRARYVFTGRRSR